MRREWHLYFIGFRLIECEPFERPLFVDARGVGWKEKHRKLVQPDDPNERGLPTVLYREDTELLLTAPMTID